MTEKVFAARLTQLRTVKGWTKQQLADAVGVSRASVSYWEMARNWPKVSELIVLATVLDCSTDWLLGLVDPP